MTKFVDHEHPDRGCPICFHKLNVATGRDHGRAPAAGGLSVCIYCGGYLIFDADLSLRRLSGAEYVELPVDIKNVLLSMRVEAALYAQWEKARREVDDDLPF